MQHSQQHGAVLLIVLLLVAVIAATALQVRRPQDQQRRMQALQAAKQALLANAQLKSFGNAATDSAKPGNYFYLPCPANPPGQPTRLEGNQQPVCGADGVNVIGHLPWRTLDMPSADQTGECLWYIVSGYQKNNPQALHNTDSYGLLQIIDQNGQIIVGATPETRPVALIVSPGPALRRQVRGQADLCGAPDVDQFLEGYQGTTTAGAISQWQTRPPSDQYNDLLVTISRDELYQTSAFTEQQLQQDLTGLHQRLAECWVSYLQNFSRLPEPAGYSLTDPRKNNQYQEQSGFAGRLPYFYDSLVGLPGCRLDEQPRWKNLWKNWKDHFFYRISQSVNFVGSQAVCVACLRLQSQPRLAVIAFAGEPLPALNQTRYLAPDTETRSRVENYLEAWWPSTATGTEDLVISGLTNDQVICINPDWSLSACD